MTVALGVALGKVHPHFHEAVTVRADELGYESVWLPEHLVFTSAMSRSPYPGAAHPPVPPDTPVFDAFAYLSFLAARTARIRLATHVYNIGLRHPFVAARGVQTLDLVSGGRAVFGVGASWLEEEWNAAQLDFATRGGRVDECIAVCRLLWTRAEASFAGEHFAFDGVVFEPKPVQRPHPPILVGGESAAALGRAARLGDGWVGMGHTFESAADRVADLHARLRAEGRDPSGFDVTVGGRVDDADDLRRWTDAGVDRVIVGPWDRSRDAVAGLEQLASRVLG